MASSHALFILLELWCHKSRKLINLYQLVNIGCLDDLEVSFWQFQWCIHTFTPPNCVPVVQVWVFSCLLGGWGSGYWEMPKWWLGIVYSPHQRWSSGSATARTWKVVPVGLTWCLTLHFPYMFQTIQLPPNFLQISQSLLHYLDNRPNGKP